MEKPTEIWRGLGPLGPCLLLLICGLWLLAEALFGRRRKQSQHTMSATRRVVLLVCGVLLVACSIAFYIMRDSLYWH